MNLGPGVIEGTRAAVAIQATADGEANVLPECQVVHEDVLTIEIDQVGSYSLMWTPTSEASVASGYSREEGLLSETGVPEPLALTAGFAFTEGIIQSLSDIATMAVCPERPDVVRLALTDPEGISVRRRNVVMNSSCGVCGGRDQLEEKAASCSTGVPDRFRIRLADFGCLQETLRAHQTVFGKTGGTHAALAFDADLACLAAAEDLGRHNALDKVIGYCLLDGSLSRGAGVFLSSRISYEMVAKAARAGFELVAAISAPSSLAIDMAERFGMTLCGFVRGKGVTVYTHAHRVLDLPGT